MIASGARSSARAGEVKTAPKRTRIATMLLLARRDGFPNIGLTAPSANFAPRVPETYFSSNGARDRRIVTRRTFVHPVPLRGTTFSPVGRRMSVVAHRLLHSCSPLAMIRRLSALLGIAMLLAILASLIWTVHRHRQHTISIDDDDSISQPL